MKIFKRVWSDIQRGENLDLYITVTISFLIVSLSLLGINFDSLIPQFTLTILGLLAISYLGNRYRLDQLLEKQLEGSGFVDKFPDDMKNDIIEASEVWIYGVSLNNTIGELYSLLENKLHEADTIRVLVIAPDSTAVELAASRDSARVIL